MVLQFHRDLDSHRGPPRPPIAVLLSLAKRELAPTLLDEFQRLVDHCP